MNRRSQQSKPTFAALLLVMALGACTIVNEHRAPPADWPELTVTINETSFKETQDKCGWNVVAAVLIGPMFGCAYVNFDQMKCDVYLWLNAVLEHELLHCKGYDHIGSTALADYWEQWKKEKK
jgi:hypothetical protein